MLRKRRPVDYNKLHSGRSQLSEEEEENSDYVEMITDLDGEKALCGSFNEEEEEAYESLHESDREDGEISEQEDSDVEESEIDLCVKTGNLEKLKRILKKRENDCKQLEQEVKKEKQKEQWDKEMRAVLAKLTKVSKT